MNLLTDLMTGWSVTVRKYSVQITAINAAWQTLALSGMIPLDPLILAFITLGLTGLSGMAANLSQETVASYNPTQYRLVPINAE